jgi:hypothetical protein
MEKYNLAASMGILVFRVPSHDISTKWLSPIIKTINERTFGDIKMSEALPTFWYEEPENKKLPNETTDEWVVRLFGAIPDTEFDQRNDFRCLNLPVSGSREDRESLGDYDYNQQPITIRKIK